MYLSFIWTKKLNILLQEWSAIYFGLLSSHQQGQVSQLCVTISMHGKTWHRIKNIWPWIIAIDLMMGHDGMIWVLGIGISDTVSDHCHAADFPHLSVGRARPFYSCNLCESARVRRDNGSSNSYILTIKTFN